MLYLLRQLSRVSNKISELGDSVAFGLSLFNQSLCAIFVQFHRT
jgi:hypothetical protein